MLTVNAASGFGSGGEVVISFTNFEAGDWTLGGGDTAGSGTLTSSGSNGASYAGGVALGSGDWRVHATVGPSGNVTSFGVFDVNVVGTYDLTAGDGKGDMDSMAWNTSFYIDPVSYSGEAYIASSADGSSSPLLANGDVCEFRQTGGNTVHIYVNDVFQHTFTVTNASNKYFALAHDNGSMCNWSDVQYYNP